MDQQKRRDMLKQTGARITPVRGLPVVTDFGDPTGEYHAARDAVAVYPALERGTVRIAGRDRIDWLHNLITQNVKTLQVGQGAYSFALDPKGRIQMDLNVFKTDDNLRLDLDRRCITQALEYFDRYIFAEDVSITDRTADFDRIALLGPRLKDLAEKLALPSVGHMPPLTFTTIEMAGQPVLAVRHDFAAVPGLELHVPSSHTPACWQTVQDAGQNVGLKPVGRCAVRTLQIEAGIPLYGEDIDPSVLPAETPVIEQAVSFTKGCFIGQELVARMRRQGSAARKMVGLRFAGRPHLSTPQALSSQDGTPVGRLTSVCDSPAADAVVGLGYVKTDAAIPPNRLRLTTQPVIEAEVVTLPFRTTHA